MALPKIIPRNKSRLMRVGEDFERFVKDLIRNYNEKVRQARALELGIKVKRVPKLTSAELTNEIYKKIKKRSQYWFWQ